jgi:hypothetical protein
MMVCPAWKEASRIYRQKGKITVNSSRQTAAPTFLAIDRTRSFPAIKSPTERAVQQPNPAARERLFQ